MREFKGKSMIALLIILPLLITACGTNNLGNTQPSNTGDTSTNPTATTSDSVTDPTETEDPVAEPPATQPPATVEVTLPAFMFEDEDMSNFDAEAYATENGLISAVVNLDGSVTITLTQDRYQEILDETTSQFDLEFTGLINSTSYITGITRNEDFSQITVTVIRDEYENAFDMTHISVGFIAAYYQGFLGRAPHVEILVADDATGNTIFSCVFPDVLSEG